MPQLPFLQVMVAVAFMALVGVVVAMPVGKHASAAAGRAVLRGSVGALLVTIAACLWWGHTTGDLAIFNARMGLEAWLQIGAFFGIVLSTGYRMAGRYIDDLAIAEGEGVSRA
jgi:hypothetical protein